MEFGQKSREWADVRTFLGSELLKGQKASDSGALLVGTKGTLFTPNDYGADFKLLPTENFEGYKGPAPTLPRNGGGDDGMKREWVAAIKGGPPAMSNFDYASLLAETVLLGNVAYRAGGGKLQYDAKTGRVAGNGNAEQYLRREYRRGWTL